MSAMSAIDQTLRDALVSTIPSYQFDRYRNYPARDAEAWQRFYLQRLDQSLRDRDNTVHYDVVDGQPVILGVRYSEWDSHHFGYGVASINLVHSQESATSNTRCVALLADILSELRSREVRFVSARLPGDMIPTIHIFEDAGFRYHETIIWPVAASSDALQRHDEAVRLMREDDMPDVVRIAETCQYQRGHFHSDPEFGRQKIGQLYAKWIHTSWTNGEPIAVIEHHDKVVGYFNFKMDRALSSALGYSYGRMRSLALDGTVRGQGLGRRLFHGTMAMIKAMGGDYIDSGYATKNHLSTRLHETSNFHSAYEEITVHLWP